MSNIWIDAGSLLVAILAFCVALLNYHKYKILTVQYNTMVHTQTLTAQGALETQIRSAIAAVTHDIVALAVEIEKNQKVKCFNMHILQQKNLTEMLMKMHVENIWMEK